MALERCPSCQGRKRIMGLGGMEHDCRNCKGIGMLEVIPPEASPKIKVKRKPIKKVISNESLIVQ